MAVVALAGADLAADSKLCAEKLAVLATCLPVVEATAMVRAPTPKCCAGVRGVLGDSKKCLRDEATVPVQSRCSSRRVLVGAAPAPATLGPRLSSAHGRWCPLPGSYILTDPAVASFRARLAH
ncbi:hypothetical protein VPH35_100697 [Triticum aestivum]